MSNLTDRVSFLKGLAEGMQLNKDKSENKLLTEIIDVLSDMAKEMAKLQEAQDELNEYVESIDDDLADMEDALFGEEEDCNCDDCDDHCSCEEDDEDEDDEIISYACPHCGHEMEFKASDVDFDEETLCPSCKKPVFPEIAEETDGDEDDQ